MEQISTNTTKFQKFTKIELYELTPPNQHIILVEGEINKFQGFCVVAALSRPRAQCAISETWAI